MRLAQLVESLRLLSLLLLPSRRCQPEKIYDILSDHNNLAEHSLYLNLGYWKSASSYDAACESLAELLGEYAQLQPGDRVLDVGSGFGDADNYWLHRFGLSSITAINLTRSQARTARQRFCDERLRIICGNALALPFDAAAFNKLLVLESAFHFEPRDIFFNEAARVLEPRGRLTLADVVIRYSPSGVIANWIAKRGRALWQTPECNLYGRETYVAKLKTAGFEDINVVSIAAHVFAPFKKFARRRVLDEEVRRRVHPLLRKIWASSHGGLDSLDYLVISATRK
ncbi:MAG: methyltransferase domain-containing protein [Gammaproteobacteria bacterium]|nr:methyltransferase domain-containing protein [Gammaproteobacteria bacterium]